MPEFLADGQPVATQDTFVDALTLGPAARVRDIIVSVLGVNAVLAQCWRYTNEDRTKWVLEPLPRVLLGQSIGVTLKNAAGIQLASATPGQPSSVIGQLDYSTDIDLTGGGVTAATIAPSGSVVPTPVTVVSSGQLAGVHGTPTPLAGVSTPIAALAVRADAANAGLVYLGGPAVDVADGYVLSAGDAVGFDVNNLSAVSFDVDTTGDAISWLAVT